MPNLSDWLEKDRKYTRTMKELQLTAPCCQLKRQQFDSGFIPPTEVLEQLKPRLDKIRKHVDMYYPELTKEKRDERYSKLCTVLYARNRKLFVEMSISNKPVVLDDRSKKILDEFLPSKPTCFPGGYNDDSMDEENKFIFRHTFSWLEDKYGALAELNQVGKEFNQKPIQFFPASGDDLGTSLKGIQYNSDKWQNSLSKASEVNRTINKGGFLIGERQENDEFNGYTTIIASGPFHEYGHAITYAIAHCLYTQIKDKPELRLSTKNDYYCCLEYVNRRLVEKIKELAKAELKTDSAPKASVRQTEQERSQGISTYGASNALEFIAEVFCHTQCAAAEKDNIKLNAYGKALNDLLKDGWESLAKTLIDEVNTPEGLKKFQSTQQLWNQKYSSLYFDPGKLPTSIWKPFQQCLDSMPNDYGQKMEKAVKQKIERTLYFATTQEEVDTKLQTLLQSLYNAKNTDLTKLFTEEESKLKENKFYQNHGDGILSHVQTDVFTWTNVLHELKKPARDIIQLQSWMQSPQYQQIFGLWTLSPQYQQTYQQWLQKFQQTNQQQIVPQNIQQLIEQFWLRDTQWFQSPQFQQIIKQWWQSPPHQQAYNQWMQSQQTNQQQTQPSTPPSKQQPNQNQASYQQLLGQPSQQAEFTHRQFGQPVPQLTK